MAGFLIGLALVVFAIWLILNLVGAVFGGLVHLLWIVIVVALIIWAVRAFTGNRTRAY